MWGPQPGRRAKAPPSACCRGPSSQVAPVCYNILAVMPASALLAAKGLECFTYYTDLYMLAGQVAATSAADERQQLWRKPHLPG